MSPKPDIPLIEAEAAEREAWSQWYCHFTSCPTCRAGRSVKSGRRNLLSYGVLICANGITNRDAWQAALAVLLENREKAGLLRSSND